MAASPPPGPVASTSAGTVGAEDTVGGEVVGAEDAVETDDVLVAEESVEGLVETRRKGTCGDIICLLVGQDADPGSGGVLFCTSAARSYIETMSQFGCYLVVSSQVSFRSTHSQSVIVAAVRSCGVWLQ